MVNHVSNRLVIHGDKEEINNLLMTEIIDSELPFAIQGFTQVTSFKGDIAVDFHTPSLPSIAINWVIGLSERYQELEFELVWYELGRAEYGRLSVAYNDYNIDCRYFVLADDTIYEFEDGTRSTESSEHPDSGEFAIAEHGHGRFARVIGELGLVYEASM